MEIRSLLSQLRHWPRRRWLAAAAFAVLFTVTVAVPTAMIPTPVFGRDLPVTWWAWPSLILSSLLAGLLAATWIRSPDEPEPATEGEAGAARGGWAAGLLTFFAVGCPVCNKLALLLLGSAGAITWFAPLQPVLQVLALALLVWGLKVRLRGERDCRVAGAPGRA